MTNLGWSVRKIGSQGTKETWTLVGEEWGVKIVQSMRESDMIRALIEKIE